MASTAPPPPSSSAVALRSPSKYAGASSASPDPLPFAGPPVEWLHRTWSVTHSTLSMWRSARNVRITYRPLAPKKDAPRLDDLVEYEALDGRGGVKSVAGVDTAAASSSTTTTKAAAAAEAEAPAEVTGAWDWRGRGLLFFVSSHWEVLGWGERPLADGGVERWAVTWFAKTVFSQEGVDIYSDRREGGSPALVEDILAALKGLGNGGAGELARLVEKDMLPVAIDLPWKEA